MDLRKLKNILSNQYFIVAILSVFALLIRLLAIAKPGGLWYDEMLTYLFSSKSFPIGIIDNLLKEDFHMPLYYLFTHLWMDLFGKSDIALRLSSVFWGVLTIPGLFWLGKSYKSKSLGYFLAVIGAISPIMIFYSQEFRFYSMLIFFSTLALIFFLKIIESPSNKNLALWIFANLVILYIYTMGIIFVSLQVLILLVDFYINKKDKLFKLLKVIFISTILALPYFTLLVQYTTASNNTLIEVFSWNGINSFSPLVLINDWFSILLSGMYVQNADIYSGFFESFKSIIVLLCISYTTVLFIVGFLITLFHLDRKMIYLTLVITGFMTIEIFLCLNGNLLMATKYTMIIYPILLLISCNGILCIKNTRIKAAVIFSILIMFTYNIINYKTAGSFANRGMGLNIPSQFMVQKQLDKDSYILFLSRSEALKKYLPNSNFIDFSSIKILYLDKTKQEEAKFFDKNFIETTNKHNSLDKLMPILANTEPSSELKSFLDNEINKIPKNKKIIFVQEVQTKNELTKKDISIFVRLYKEGKLKKEIANKYIFPIMQGKMGFDIITALDQNPNIAKINFKTFTNKKTNKWEFYVYKKIN